MNDKTEWTDVQLPVFGKEDLRNMTYIQAEEVLLGKVYEVTALFEQLEHAGKVHGNGHHMRQQAQHAVKRILKAHWRRNQYSRGVK